MINSFKSVNLILFLLNDKQHVDTIIAKLIERREISYLESKNENFILQILKILKTLFFKISPIPSINSKEGDETLNVSLDYFKKDVYLRVPTNTMPFSNQKIGIFCGIFYLYFIFKLYLYLDKQYRKNGIFKEIAIGSLFYLGISSKNLQEVRYHYYSFVPEVFISSYLTSIDETINSVFYMHMRFIDPSSSIVCNQLVNENEISHSYCIKNKDIYVAQDYTYEIKKHHIFPSSSFQKNVPTLGFYSSGMNARKSSNYFKTDKINQWINIEEKVLELLTIFVSNHNDYDLTIFPHYTRGVESIASAKNYYQKFMDNPNIKLHMHSNNKNDYKKINLGVTVESNVFWDRMHIGHKTILVDSLIAKDFLNDTSLKNFYIDTEKLSNDEFFNMLIKMLHMNFEDFQKDFLA